MKEPKLRRGIDARDLPINDFYDFRDGNGYASARTRKAVFQALALYGANAYPSTQTLVDKLGITEQHLRRIINWLKENGFLRVEYKKGPNGTNLYNVQFPGAPEHLDDRPEHIDADPNISGGTPEHDHVPQKKESNIERKREKEEPRPTRSSDLVGQVLKEIVKAGGTTTSKGVAAISALLSGMAWTEREIVSGTRRILDRLDAFEMKQAGDRVSSNLESEINLERERLAEASRQQEQMQAYADEAREQIERELQGLDEGIELAL